MHSTSRCTRYAAGILCALVMFPTHLFSFQTAEEAREFTDYFEENIWRARGQESARHLMQGLFFQEKQTENLRAFRDWINNQEELQKKQALQHIFLSTVNENFERFPQTYLSKLDEYAEPYTDIAGGLIDGLSAKRIESASAEEQKVLITTARLLGKITSLPGSRTLILKPVLTPQSAAALYTAKLTARVADTSDMHEFKAHILAAISDDTFDAVKAEEQRIKKLPESWQRKDMDAVEDFIDNVYHLAQTVIDRAIMEKPALPGVIEAAEKAAYHIDKFAQKQRVDLMQDMLKIFPQDPTGALRVVGQAMVRIAEKPELSENMITAINVVRDLPGMEKSEVQRDLASVRMSALRIMKSYDIGKLPQELKELQKQTAAAQAGSEKKKQLIEVQLDVLGNLNPAERDRLQPREQMAITDAWRDPNVTAYFDTLPAQRTSALVRNMFNAVRVLLLVRDYAPVISKRLIGIMQKIAGKMEEEQKGTAARSVLLDAQAECVVQLSGTVLYDRKDNSIGFTPDTKYLDKLDDKNRALFEAMLTPEVINRIRARMVKDFTPQIRLNENNYERICASALQWGDKKIIITVLDRINAILKGNKEKEDLK